MKRVLTVTSALILASTSLLASTAASQETTTTTEAEVTTTTEAPAATTTEAPTTTAAPVDETTTTAAPVEETTTTVAVPEEPLELPGQHVTAGQLAFDIRFTDSPAANCTKTLDLAGGQVNIGLDEAGNIGGVYGLAPSGGGGTAGVFMIGLGAMPAGVGILSVSDGDCEFDAVGIGSFASDGGWARINGVGAGLHPGYETPDYVNMFLVDAKIDASAAPAVLDMDFVKNFLLRDRPGLVIPEA